DIIGIIGGFFVSVYKLGIAATVYKNDILDYMRVEDLCHGLIKSVFFALIIFTVACYKGFNCEGGAEGVGRATTQTVVISMVMILVSDYFLTALLVLFGVG
ncbi:MAG TPA: ABC transporter permease, partial [Elusimicrobia bacterium]|nr:ABC transporter permease [Elusimicrobiota bacterium]